MSKLFFFFFIILVIFPIHGTADTIFFKNGMRLDVSEVWEENGQIKCKLYGTVVGYPKENILKVEKNELKKTESDDIKSDSKIEQVNKTILIGEWRDYLGSFWDLRIKIIKENNKFHRINTFADGSSSKALLIEISPLKNYKKCFKDIERGRGEMYAIDYNGDLGLFDSHGFIRC